MSRLLVLLLRPLLLRLQPHHNNNKLNPKLSLNSLDSAAVSLECRSLVPVGGSEATDQASNEAILS